MAMYLIGDIQGCDEPLQRLLHTLDFSPSRDTLFVLGDLVNRGPGSAAVLRRLMGYGDAARCVLGNHDLHLLAAAAGARAPQKKDTLSGVLEAPDRDAMLGWLRSRRMAMAQRFGDVDVLMVHAGVLPAWSVAQAINLAGELEAVLGGPDCSEFLHRMYGNTPDAWHETLTGTDRLRVIVNALTRLRFCTADGVMEFDTKEGNGAAPAGYMPWFDVPGRATSGAVVAFGHWSTLGWTGRPDALCLDTGCVWGGCLSALRVAAGTPGAGLATELIQVKCPQSQAPG